MPGGGGGVGVSESCSRKLYLVNSNHNVKQTEINAK